MPTNPKEDARLMAMAIALSEQNVERGGGPFGAVIAKEGKVIATGVNRVVPDTDPTAHAEVNAIRAACRETGCFKLEGCTIYTSCEPCPLCLSAIYWAGIGRICYGNTKEDAKAIEFDDSFIYDELAKPYEERAVPCKQMMHEEAQQAFRMWSEKEDKVEY